MKFAHYLAITAAIGAGALATAHGATWAATLDAAAAILILLGAPKNPKEPKE